MEQRQTDHKNRAHEKNSMLPWDPASVMPSFWNMASFDPFWWDNDVFASTRKNMTWMIDNFLNNVSSAWGTQGSNADISEDEKSLRIKMDVPGLEEEDIDISADNGMLTISADKHEDKNGTETRFSFSQSVSLPEGVNVDQAHVNFTNHRLDIEIPKGDGAARRAINHAPQKKQAKARHRRK